MAASILIGMNIFFIYYCILRGFSQGLGWQYQFIVSFLVNMAIDICLLETVDCLWLNYMIPESVRSDVQKALKVMYMIANNLEYVLNAVDDVELYHGENFDAPSYFFVSKQLAKMRPNLVESHLVLAYRNNFPGLLCRTWPHYQRLASMGGSLLDPDGDGERDGVIEWFQDTWKRIVEKPFRGGMIFAIVSGISAGILYVLQTVGVLPLIYQKFIIRLMQSAVLTIITLLYFLTTEHPMYMLGIALILFVIASVVAIRVMIKDATTSEELDHTAHQSQGVRRQVINVHSNLEEGQQQQVFSPDKFANVINNHSEEDNVMAMGSNAPMSPDGQYHHIINQMIEEEFEEMANKVPTNTNEDDNNNVGSFPSVVNLE